MPHHQLIVVGGGLSGLRAAVEAKADGLDVAILSQVHPGRSHSGAAQGGINAALGQPPRRSRRHAREARLRHGQGQRLPGRPGRHHPDDQGRPGCHLRDGPLGLPVQPLDDGRIAQRPFGGAGFPRTCYGADKTGHYLLHTLVERAYERQVKIYVEVLRAPRSSSHEGVCRGVVAYDMIRGGFEAFTANAVVIATGGAGRIYSNSTNASSTPAAAWRMAYQAGRAR